jgi:hypothetical protein
MLPMEIISPFSLILNVALNGVLENDASLCSAPPSSSLPRTEA